MNGVCKKLGMKKKKLIIESEQSKELNKKTRIEGRQSEKLQKEAKALNEIKLDIA